MKYQSVKGFRDIIGGEAERFTSIEEIARNIFEKYNYQEIKIPIVESAELFTRSIGETTDIVEKEMYVFEDKGKRKIALRPEATAGVVRAYIENNLSQKYPSQKFFYTGSMFRQERPQAGRFREFFQIGCEWFGNASIYADIEIILLAKEIIETVGVKNIKIEINFFGCEKCQPVFINSLKNVLKREFDGLCGDCKRRLEKNPLRVLDCKIDSEKFTDLKPELCSKCSGNFEGLKTDMKNAGVDFAVSNKLVRGLDYYTKMVFEITSDFLGSQNAICAGGRYDNLVKELGGASTPAVGFAIGVDRLADVLEKSTTPYSLLPTPCLFVCATENMECRSTGFDVLQKIRKTGISADGGYFEKSLKSQMRLAGALESRYVIIAGDEEIKKKIVTLRDMKSKIQKEISVKEIIEEVKKCCGQNS